MNADEIIQNSIIGWIKIGQGNNKIPTSEYYLNNQADWTEIPITFRAKCYDCGKEILPGPAFWSDSKKCARHLECGKRKSQIEDQTLQSSKLATVSSGKVGGGFKKAYESIELKCFMCGKMAGCHACTFSTVCDRRIVSQLCVCKTCSSTPSEDAYNRYQQAFIQKYLHKKKNE